MLTEVRLTQNAPQIRAAAGDEPTVLHGLAGPYNKRSTDLPGFVEIIKPGAFAGSIRDDAAVLVGHDNSAILGRQARNAEIVDSKPGLAFEVSLPDTVLARDTATLVRDGILDSMSFAFRTNEGDATWSEEPDGTLVRTIHKVRETLEVSIVTWAAYGAGTSVAARSAGEALDKYRAELDAQRREADAETRAWIARADVRLRRLELDAIIL